MAGFDPKALKVNEWGVVGGAAVAFIGLFFHAYTVHVEGLFGGAVSGWSFAGLWIPVLLLLAAAGLVALKALQPALLPPVLLGLAAVIPLLVGALALIIELLRWLTYDRPSHIDAGAGFGTYLVIVATAVAAVFAYLNVTSTGLKLSHLKYLIPTRPSTPPTDPS